MDLKVRVLEDGEWRDIKPLSALYARRFDEIRISGIVFWADSKEMAWVVNELLGRLAPKGEVNFGGS